MAATTIIDRIIEIANGGFDMGGQGKLVILPSDLYDRLPTGYGHCEHLTDAEVEAQRYADGEIPECSGLFRNVPRVLMLDFDDNDAG